MNDDYVELDLYLEQDEEVDLWVYTAYDKFVLFKNVNGNPVRYNGWWNIPHISYNRQGTAYLEAKDIKYFSTYKDIDESDQ